MNTDLKRERKMIAMYEKMYYTLFHAITDAMEMMKQQEYQGAISRLELACRDAEETYISQ